MPSSPTPMFDIGMSTRMSPRIGDIAATAWRRVSATSTMPSSAAARPAHSGRGRCSDIPPSLNDHAVTLVLARVEGPIAASGHGDPVDAQQREARWISADGAAHTKWLRTERQAVQHVVRYQAGGLCFHDLRHSSQRRPSVRAPCRDGDHGVPVRAHRDCRTARRLGRRGPRLHTVPGLNEWRSQTSCSGQCGDLEER